MIAGAAAAGLSAVALTDHDTLAGIPEAAAAAAVHGVELIPGTELSVDWPGGTMHVLCYFLDPAAPGPLQERLAEVRDSRAGRNRLMVERLHELGVDIDHAEVAAESGDGVTGRPHIAAVLVRKGVAASIGDAFDRYLAAGRPAYVDRFRLGHGEAAHLARREGAVPVLAHPHTIGVGADDYRAAFADVAAAGLMGIEAHYAEYAPEVRAALAGIAASLGLVATGGSDYHGTYKAEVSLGTGRGDLTVADEVLAALKAARDRL